MEVEALTETGEDLSSLGDLSIAGHFYIAVDNPHWQVLTESPLHNLPGSLYNSPLNLYLTWSVKESRHKQ